MPSFSDAINRQAETIKRPPPLPVGHYVLQITKMPEPPEQMNSKVGVLEKLTIQCQTVSPHDDVDPEELAEFGNPAGVPLRLDFLFNTEDEMKFDGTLNRLKNFCAACGIDVTSGTVGDWLPQLPNAQFLGEVKHRADPNDADIIYSEIGRTAAL